MFCLLAKFIFYCGGSHTEYPFTRSWRVWLPHFRMDNQVNNDRNVVFFLAQTPEQSGTKVFIHGQLTLEQNLA
jgi:hypothetical protein